MAVMEAMRKLTVEDFLAQPESDERMELVDGEIIMSPRARSSHQRMVAYLSHLLLSRVANSGAVIVEKEMVVSSLDGEQQVRVPDLCYIRQSRQDIIADEAIRGPADIVIEILSRGTEEIDRITKRDEYRATGVPEYWIVDLESRALLIHDFAKGSQALFRSEDPFESQVLRELDLPAAFTVTEVFEILS